MRTQTKGRQGERAEGRQGEATQESFGNTTQAGSGQGSNVVSGNEAIQRIYEWASIPIELNTTINE